jgi:hypothetical protein
VGDGRQNPSPSEIPQLSLLLHLLGYTKIGPCAQTSSDKLCRVEIYVIGGSRRGQRLLGSLTGAVHLSNGNAGVLRSAQRGRKPRVEHKGKCWLDLDFQ